MNVIKASKVANSITAISEIYKGLLVFTNLEQQAQMWAKLFYDELRQKTNDMLTGSEDDFEVFIYNNRKGMTLTFDHLQFVPVHGDKDVCPATITIEMVETNTSYKNIKLRQLVCENIVMTYRPQGVNKNITVFSGKFMASDRDAILKFIAMHYSKV